MPFAKYGLGLIFGSFLLLLVFLVLAVMTKQISLIILTVITGIFAIFNLYFFRDPERNIPDNPDAILSPADGKVVQITQVEDAEYFNRKVTRISIFLSVFNVHVNRVPISGIVDHFAYHRGKFLAAFKEDASVENEQTVIAIKGQNERKVMFKQIAGIIARRIVCTLREGNNVRAGEKMGMIRYSSRVDVLFDSEQVEIKVQVGDKAKGGETILGVFR